MLDYDTASGIEFKVPPFTSSISIPFKFDAKMEMSCEIEKIQSPYSLNQLIHRSSAEIDFDRNSSDSSFGFNVYLKNQQQPKAWVEIHEEDRNQMALMISFFPKFSSKIATEIVIILDRSRSMSGKPIRDAASTVERAVKILPDDALVNIIGKIFLFFIFN